MPNYNWIPESFEKFREAAWQGRVSLGILDKQYPWLYANTVPFSTFKKYSYKTRLLRRMAYDLHLYRKVHNFGIDLILHEKPAHGEEFIPNYHQEHIVEVALTLVALLVGGWLWLSEEWHVSVVYLAPLAIFGLSESVVNSLMDDHDQAGTPERLFRTFAWPIVVISFISQLFRKES